MFHSSIFMNVHHDKSAFPHDKALLGCVLGPAHNVGNAMSQWVLLGNCQIVARRTVCPLTVAEGNLATEEIKRKVFTKAIEAKYGSHIDSVLPPPTRKRKQKGESVSDIMEVLDSEEANERAAEEEKWEPYEDLEETAATLPPMESIVDIHGNPVCQQLIFDKLLNVEICEQGKLGKVKQRVVHPETGRAMGTYDDRVELNTMMYEVEFDDGSIREYGATAIAENILSQVDEDGFWSPMLKSIVEAQKDPKVAVDKAHGMVEDCHGRRKPRKTTEGWELLVLWSDGSKTWIPLKYLKESNPVDVADFAVAENLQEEPAFAWWVPFTLRKRDAIISAVKT